MASGDGVVHTSPMSLTPNGRHGRTRVPTAITTLVVLLTLATVLAACGGSSAPSLSPLTAADSWAVQDLKLTLNAVKKDAFAGGTFVFVPLLAIPTPEPSVVVVT